jgi:hypothetical protein
VGASVSPPPRTPAGREPLRAEEREILLSVLGKLRAALGNVETALAAEAASGGNSGNGLAGVKAEVERAISLVDERIA